MNRHHLSSHNTVLHVAATRGHLPVIRYLLQFCKVPGLPISPPIMMEESHYKELNINAMNVDGKTALQLAAEKGRIMFLYSFVFDSYKFAEIIYRSMEV